MVGLAIERHFSEARGPKLAPLRHQIYPQQLVHELLRTTSAFCFCFLNIPTTSTMTLLLVLCRHDHLLQILLKLDRPLKFDFFFSKSRFISPMHTERFAVICFHNLLELCTGLSCPVPEMLQHQMYTDYPHHSDTGNTRITFEVYVVLARWGKNSDAPST